MEYRTLGSSGRAVSTPALGMMTFGAETDEEGAHAQLDRFAGGVERTWDVVDAVRAIADEREVSTAQVAPARLDSAGDPGAADHPYGGPGTEQRSRKLGGTR